MIGFSIIIRLWRGYPTDRSMYIGKYYQNRVIQSPSSILWETIKSSQLMTNLKRWWYKYNHIWLLESIQSTTMINSNISSVRFRFLLLILSTLLTLWVRQILITVNKSVRKILAISSNNYSMTQTKLRYSMPMRTI